MGGGGGGRGAERERMVYFIGHTYVSKHKNKILEISSSLFISVSA